MNQSASRGSRLSRVVLRGGPAALVMLALACTQAEPAVTPSPVATAIPTPARPALASPAPSPSPGLGTLAPVETYVVKPGDTLAAIAENLYGDAQKWQMLYEANKDVIGENPNILKVDTKLRVPRPR